MSPPEVGFTLTVPSSWFELDVVPATRDAALASLVDERVEQVPELREHRGTITRLLRQQARSAWDFGARFAAALVDPTDDGPVTASVTVSVVTGPLGTDRQDRDAHLSALLAPLQPKAASGPDDTWREVDVIEVPGAGAAARVRAVEDVDLPDDAGWVRVVSLQLLVPVPGSTQVVIVSCSSPVLPLAAPLLDVFDAIGSTLTVLPASPRRSEATRPQSARGVPA